MFEQVSDVKKIAVLRANALGDFIFVLPALEALKAAYPQAELVLLARDWHAKFLTERPGSVDRVLVIPHGGLGDERDLPVEDRPNMEVLFEQWQTEKFDIALQMHGGGRNSNPFLLKLGARVTAGLRTPDAPALDRCLPYVYYQTEVVRYLEVAELVGARPLTLEPQLVVTEADVAEARQVLGEELPVRLVALHPGATDPRRRWPVESFARLGDALAAEGATVVVTGTAAEQELTKGVVAAMQKPALDLCGRLSLSGLAGLLSLCQVVISNDSGPLHLAGAVGTPTVGIYWVGNAITASTPLRRRHRPLISWRVTCPVCGRDCINERCEHNVSFVADVTVEEVQATIKDLL